MLVLSSTDRFALRAKRGSHPSTLNRGVSDHECPLHRSWLTALEQPECLRRVESSRPASNDSVRPRLCENARALFSGRSRPRRGTTKPLTVPPAITEGKSEDVPPVALCFPPFGFETALPLLDVPLIHSESSQYVTLIRHTQGLRVFPGIRILRRRLTRISVLRASIQLGMVRLVSENASAILY